MKRFFLSALVVGFMFAGCAEKKVVTQPDQPVPPETVQKAAPEAAKTEAPAPAAKAAPEKVETVTVREVTVDKPAATAFESIYFDFDRYDIRDDAKPILQSSANYLIKNKPAKVLIEGHCDERGTNEYNLALGEKRAKSARDYLVSLGVTKDRLNTISYGEEKPLCREQTEECWQKNRRAQFMAEGPGK